VEVDVLERTEEVSKPRKVERFRETDVHKLVFEVIFLACSGIVLGLTAYSIVASVMGHIDVVGATLVNVQIPSQAEVISVKPVSILMAAALGMAFSGLELARPMMLKFSNTTFSYLKLLIFVGTALCSYEVFYNFAIWIAQLTTGSISGILNPDIVVNSFPNPQTPWNLVFATKLTTTIFAIGLYALYFIRSLEREKVSLT
jgi:hypothetical protein